MLTKKKSTIDAALEQLDRISKDSQSALAIIRSARAEVEAEDGKNPDSNDRELEARCGSDTALRNARSRLAALRIELQTIAEADVIPEMQRLESEVRELHRANMELVRREIVERTERYLGDALARKCANVAPVVLAEQDFQSRHAVSEWVRSTRVRFGRCTDFDGEDLAAGIARHMRAIVPMVESVRVHSEQLRQRFAAGASA